MLRRFARQAGAALMALAVCTTAAEAEKTYPISKPPGNVSFKDYAELFGGAVSVTHLAKSRGVPDAKVEVMYMGRDGRYFLCGLKAGSASVYIAPMGLRWKARRWSYGNGDRAYPELVNGRNISGDNGHYLVPVYNGRSGAIRWYTTHSKRWRKLDQGHLQKRLPRAVWTLCPNFPSAKSLGVGINEKQTAVNYHKLVRQDKGQRIKRPDLVTRNPVECLNRKTGKYSLCKGRK